jgi:hypothetical protein
VRALPLERSLFGRSARAVRRQRNVESDRPNDERLVVLQARGRQLRAPLLHAAALWPMQRFKTMRDVYNWVQIRTEDEPTEILHMAKAEDAIRGFQSVYAYNDRQRDGIIGAAAAVLQAYGNPAVERTLTARRMLTPEKLFAPGQTNTLYIVADREHQKLLAPLVVTLISTLLHYVAGQENDGRPLQPPCLCALDETANIAPSRTSPRSSPPRCRACGSSPSGTAWRRSSATTRTRAPANSYPSRRPRSSS